MGERDGSGWSGWATGAATSAPSTRAVPQRPETGHTYRPSDVRLPTPTATPRSGTPRKRLRPGAVLVRLFRDVDYGGPSFGVTVGSQQPDGDVLIDLNAYWSQNLSALKPGDVGMSEAELIHADHGVPPLRVRLPMARLDGRHWHFNDRIVQIRLLADPR